MTKVLSRSVEDHHFTRKGVSPQHVMHGHEINTPLHDASLCRVIGNAKNAAAVVLYVVIGSGLPLNKEDIF